MSKELINRTEQTSLYKLDQAKANEISKIIESHGYKSKIIIFEDDKEIKKKDGVYLITGLTDEDLQHFDSLSQDELYKEAQYKQTNEFLILPHGAVFKMNSQDGLHALSSLLDHTSASEFVSEKFKDYNLAVPDEISGVDFAQLYYTYSRMVDIKLPTEERQHFARSFKYLIELYASGLPEIEYLKKMENQPGYDYKDRLNYILSNKTKPTKEYHSKSKFAIDKELLEKRGETTFMNVNHDSLKYIERELSEYDDVYYHIDPVSRAVDELTSDSILQGEFRQEDHRTYYHTLTFNKNNENLIASIVHMAEHEEIKNRAQYLFHNPANPKFGVAIPVIDIDNFLTYADYYDINFTFDRENIYVESNTKEIGIVVDTNEEFVLLNKCLKNLYKDKSNSKLLDRAAEKDCIELEKLEKQDKIKYSITK